jgi:hypothetical protein
MSIVQEDPFLAYAIFAIATIGLVGLAAAVHSRRGSASSPEPRPKPDNKIDYLRPTRQQIGRSSPAMPYPALRLISFLLKVVGWVAIVLGVCCLSVTFGFVGSNMKALIGGGMPSDVSPIFISVVTSIGIFLFIVGLWNLAIGEGIKVFIDIALNTEPLRHITQDWSPLRPR